MTSSLLRARPACAALTMLLALLTNCCRTPPPYSIDDHSVTPAPPQQRAAPQPDIPATNAGRGVPRVALWLMAGGSHPILMIAAWDDGTVVVSERTQRGTPLRIGKIDAQLVETITREPKVINPFIVPGPGGYVVDATRHEMTMVMDGAVCRRHWYSFTESGIDLEASAAIVTSSLRPNTTEPFKPSKSLIDALDSLRNQGLWPKLTPVSLQDP